MLVKPSPLVPGAKVAVLSPSWGGPEKFPHVFDRGLDNVRRLLEVEIVEFPTARMPNDELYLNPKQRAEDINRAFADPTISAIFASIGGDDSVRILPFINFDSALRNPKILMGYSDTTTLTATLAAHGLVTFSGPSIMAGFGQIDRLPESYGQHVAAMLTGSEREYRPFSHWVDNYADWAITPYEGKVEEWRSNDEGWQVLQDGDAVEGCGRHVGSFQLVVGRCLPAFGMSGVMPGMSRPGRRPCQ